MRNFFEKNKGITLIALVVTIVILLILAGISIGIVFGEGGIIDRARDAGEKTNIAIADEQQMLQNVVNWVNEYANGNNSSENEDISGETNLIDFEEEIYIGDKIARIGNNYYDTLQEAIDAVSTDNKKTEVVLLKNTTEDLNIAENKNIVLNINNKTITGKSTNEADTMITNKGTLILHHGKVTSSNNVIYNYGTLKIELGTEILSTSTTRVAIKSSGNFTMQTGLISTSNGTTAFDNIENGITNIGGEAEIRQEKINDPPQVMLGNEGNIMNITGGNFKSASGMLNNVGNLNITGGNFSCNGYAIYNYENATIGKIIGGTLTSDSTRTIENHGTINEISGTVNIKNSSSESSVVSNYATIGTITGGTITSEVRGMCIYNEGTVKEIGGDVKLEGKVGNGALISNNKAEAVIEKITGGTLTSENSNVIYNKGTIKEISGTANIKNSSTGSSVVANYATMGTITGGTITSEICGMCIYNEGTVKEIGGDVKLEGKAGNKVLISNNTAEAVIEKITGGTIISENTNAISNNGNIGTIIGGTITSEKSGAVSNDGNIGVITGGTLTSKNSSTIFNKGTINEISGTVNIKNNSSNGTNIYNYAEGTIEAITGGTITSETFGMCLYNLGMVKEIGGDVKLEGKVGNGALISNNKAEAVIETITGGTMTSEKSKVISNNGNIGTIIGGTLTSEKSNAISNKGTIQTITGGTITSEDSTISNSGTITSITGGKLTSRIRFAIDNLAAGTIENLSGGTIKSETSAAMYNLGKITEINGNVEFESTAVATIMNGEKAIIEKIAGGKINANDGSALTNLGTLNEISGTVEMKNDSSTYCTLGNSSTGIIGKMIGGKIIAKDGVSVFNQGGTINQIGGTIIIENTSASSPTFYNYNGTITTVDGGTIRNNTSGGWAAYNDSGTVNYVKATITGQSNF